ncbi:MAG TPA: TonB-dependent receptor [Steroidobacteraceae bacterium]
MVSARQAVASILRSARSTSDSRLPLGKSAGAASALCLLTATLSWAPHAFAQQAPSADANSDQQLQEVTVTGSRIKHTTDYTTSTPTTVIDAETMQNLGVVNVGQMLELTPSNVSAYTPQTTGGSSFYTGAYIADLRGFNGFFSGARTLVMIDGNRVIATNTQDSFDLNFIPQILVSRTETVTGGASAAYGSGAESGVLNVILDRQLEGGKFNADEYDTHYNDAKDRHVAAAYGHGLFDNRLHFVVAAEYESSDPSNCQTSGRSWCSANAGPYDNASPYPGVDTSVLGRGLTTNTTANGVIGPNYFNFGTYSYSNLGQPLYQASADGTSVAPFSGNNSFLGTGPGGSGVPVNQYTYLQTAVSRAVFSGMLTGKITDSITANLDLNWGKVQAFNPENELTTFTVGSTDPYLLDSSTTSGLLDDLPNVTGPTGNTGYGIARDMTGQFQNSQYNDTTLKRIGLTLNGKFGDSSWTWRGFGEFGKTVNVEGTPNELTNDEAGMAADVVNINGTPQCRITAYGNNLTQTLNSAINPLTGGFNGGGGAASGYSGLPEYLQQINTVLTQTSSPINPVTGLTELQSLNLLAPGCLPFNPLGNQALPAGVANYITGPLSLTMDLTQKQFSLNSTGEIWKGVGAGPFSLAVGYDWRSTLLHNDFTACPDGLDSTTAAEQLCLTRATDFNYQFGNPYAGSVTANEVYLELNTPILKDLPFAHRLEFDLAGRESRYTNDEEYAVGIAPGAQSSYNLPTWKASLLYEPVEGLRFRASQSHDSRSPNQRDLYYSQTFVPGGFFGVCPAGNPNSGVQSPACFITLAGNADLKPETTNTTTLGLVFSPVDLKGLQASADWFHIHLTNGINGGGGAVGADCYDGGAASAYYCSQLSFNDIYYSPTTGAPVAAGTPGAVTGLAAYKLGNVANVLSEYEPALNGAFYDERGVDFSVTYTAALPGGSTLSARALATWVGEQTYQNAPGSATVNLLGQMGAGTEFLPDYTNAAHWHANMSITWALGGFSLTPNMLFIGSGTLNNLGVFYNPANPSTAAQWILTGYPDANLAGTPGAPADAAAQAAARTAGAVLLPENLANRVPSYFEFGLNAAYTFDKIPGLKGLQLFTQVNNLLNKSPPFTGGTTSNPIFYDQLGLAYRVGFRMTF